VVVNVLWSQKRARFVVFGSERLYEGRGILWITQLCVHFSHRNQGVAKSMLQAPYQDEARVGILSSHPFSISAFLRVFGSGIENLEAYQLEMTRKEERCVLSSCPVSYVKTAKLRGNLFEDECDGDKAICCADTGFWVALRVLGQKGVVWPLEETCSVQHTRHTLERDVADVLASY